MKRSPFQEQRFPAAAHWRHYYHNPLKNPRLYVARSEYNQMIFVRYIIKKGFGRTVICHLTDNFFNFKFSLEPL